MKKSFITQMPDKVGSFLKASKEISSVGANIVRVSYNKAIDLHMLFIDVSGTEEQINKISVKLKALGYICDNDNTEKVMLIEFHLQDIPGAVLPILELIQRYKFNISYINSQENGSNYQNFRMGLYVTDSESVKEFLEKSSKICDVKIIDYDKSKKVLDNTVFYLSFANEIACKLNLDRKLTNNLIADSNLIMQMLDENDNPTYKVFDKIAKFADLILKYKGASFNAKITKKALKADVNLYVIEPPCGSNVTILEKNEKLLFVDCGFACYENEMNLLLSTLFSNFKEREKILVVTHPDIDHCGLIKIFRKVYLSQKAYENFEFESNNLPNFREQNKKHAPYCRISKILTEYKPFSLNNMVVIDKMNCNNDKPITKIGNLEFENLNFDIYLGNGGHAIGEIVIVCEELKIIFSGDILVNIFGFSKEQKEFNNIAPYLMTSVNMDTEKALIEREYLLKIFNPENYNYCCGHGAIIPSKK